MAAKIDRVDQAYWEEAIKPLVDAHPNVEFIGEINEREKPGFLGGAEALLFPIEWPEPFGIVMIEAMACGTPVIAFPSGSAPEVIDDGVSGYLVDDVAEAVRAVRRIQRFDRRQARACFERRFTIDRVARDYVNIYRDLPGVRITAPRVRLATGWEAPAAPTISVFDEIPRPRPVSTPAVVRFPTRPHAAPND